MGQPLFIGDNFLLQTDEAIELYHTRAKELPVIDYHCHLPVADIACDRKFANMTDLWLAGDHYKWRAMRANGVAEHYCTGNADDREKFQKWAETVPCLLRNQLYAWSHLELARYFGITDRLIGADTAQGIWDECNSRLEDPSFSARGLMKRSNVVLVCTTDDPVDSLEHHRTIAADSSFDIRVLPTWRPDRGMAVEDPSVFNEWVDRLGVAADTDISDFASYMTALEKRHAFFHDMSCRLSDHGIETAYAEDYGAGDIKRIFSAIRGGKNLSPAEIIQFKSAMLYEFGVMDHGREWTQQYHFGALRNNNTRMFGLLGPDSGYDSIGDSEIGRPLVKLLDRLDSSDQLAKTILYNLNPRDNTMLVAIMGSFQDGSMPGKMQFGSAWWFLDQKDGMERQMNDLSQIGLLSRFVGMLTDSRSFLSYPRHEYFRRILCNMLGNDMKSGFVPADMDLAGQIVADISYHNAAAYFGFDL